MPKVPRHSGGVSRNQHTPGIRGDPKNVRIRRAIRNDAAGGTKINGWFPTSLASAYSRIQISVSLEAKAQGSLINNSRLARSKRCAISGGNG